MIRKHAASTLLAAIALQASLAHGLGLGDITLRSALDQPLAAEIRLRGVGDLNPTQIVVGLGSAADFERAGVERVYFLSDIQFEVALDGQGDGVVRLSTDQPIREPYLDFVVEVRWPTGRVLREYTVLLDLPTYTAARTEPVRAPRAQAWSGAGGSAAATAADDGGLAIGSGEYTVGAGQTLWSIANRAKPAGVSTQRMMAAIHAANPGAFIGGDMNRVRAGAVLRMPEGSDLVALSQTAARSAAAAPATPGGGEEAAPAAMPAEPAAAPVAEPGAAAAEGEGQLVLAGDTAEQPGAAAAGGVGEAGGSAGAGADLTAVQENLSAAERANAELKARVAALEAQVKDYEKLAELKSDTLSQTQQAAGEEKAPAAAAQPAEAAKAPAAPEPGLLERLLASTVAQVAALAALLLAMLAFLFKRRRTVEEFVPAPERPLRPAPAPAPGVVEPRKETPRASDLAPAPATELAGAEFADPVGEAEIYLAYGRHERAIEILRDALHADPAQTDVRLKLMEIHDARGEQQEFMQHYAALAGDAAAQQAARDHLEHGKNPQWLAVLTTGAAALAAVGVEPRLDREHELSLDLEAELTQAGSMPAPEEELELGEIDDADLDFLAQAAAEPERSHHDAMLAKTGDAIARAAAELDLGAEDVAADNGDFAGFELDLDRDVPDAFDLSGDEAPAGAEGAFDLPLGDLELGEPVAAAGAEDADLAFLQGTDETETKLELARAYLDMGDFDGARDILAEVTEEGSPEQREQATALLERIRLS